MQMGGCQRNWKEERQSNCLIGVVFPLEVMKKFSNARWWLSNIELNCSLTFRKLILGYGHFTTVKWKSPREELWLA